ncbi:MAG: PEP-CTERM sorting domain-containing protein [Planctomycetia bacterium]|nr:PEP-CTERM sorting domain-containing protein [Planctomycetia bacterium]
MSRYFRCVTQCLCAIVFVLSNAPASAAPIQRITIDGQFGDWAKVPSYTDAAGDTHDTDHDGLNDTPESVFHPDVDLLEFKFTHDEENLYAYFRSASVVGRTQVGQGNQRAGRSYVIVTIDVDHQNDTGYWLHEGGYYPTSDGYDMNMEIEFYNGTFNTGHYLNHGATSARGLALAEADQKQGVVRVLPGTYDYYTQWSMFEDPTTGDHDLQDGTSITFVADGGPIHHSIIYGAASEDGSEFEMVAPFRGFMNYPGASPGERGDPILALGRTIDVSFSLEASGELWATNGGNGVWASDTAFPIEGYTLEAVPEPSSIALLGMSACAVALTFVRRNRTVRVRVFPAVE